MSLLLDGFRSAIELLATWDRTTMHALGVSLACTITAVLLAGAAAIPFGAWLGFYRPDSRVRILLLRTGMSFPTVIIGLAVYMLLTRRGVLGSFDLLYTKWAIVLGEFCLAFPLLATLSHGIARSLDPLVIETARTLGASRIRALLTALGECRSALAGAGLAAFGRCLTELGIAVTVGGNIAENTRTLPSAIQLELSRGQFDRALACGILLLVVALLVTVASHIVSGEARR